MLVEEQRPLADAAERHIARWIEAHVGGRVVRIARQGRWRPAWHVDVDRDGRTLALYVRGERVENFLPYSLEREFRVWRRLEAGGLRVPHDVSIVGFDDIGHSAYCLPPLTSVKQPLHALGREAANAIVALIEGHKPSREPMAGLELIVRESTSAPSR